MARDRLFMAIALVGLTASIVWVGHRVAPGAVAFPSLITSGLSIESPAALHAAVSKQLESVPRIQHLRHPRWCKKKRTHRTVSIQIPNHPAAPAAPDVPSVSSSAGAS